MVTRVGKQSNFVDAMKELLELEYDALEAYQAAIDRLENQTYKQKLQEYKTDHQSHIKELSGYLAKYTEDVPTGPCSKQWLAKGKVILGNLFGDKNIIDAMISNEEDTNQAYENVCQHEDKWPEIDAFLSKAYEDEKRHKANLEEASRVLGGDRDEHKESIFQSENPDGEAFSIENADVDALNNYKDKKPLAKKDSPDIHP